METAEEQVENWKINMLLFGTLVGGIVLGGCWIFINDNAVGGDTRDEAKAWVEFYIPEGSRVALDWAQYMPVLNQSEKQLREKLAGVQGGRKRRLEHMLEDIGYFYPSYELFFMKPGADDGSSFSMNRPVIDITMAALKENNIDYVLVLRAYDNYPLYKELEQSAELLATFTPYRDKTRLKAYDKVAMTALPFTWEELTNRTQTGQSIQVYKL